MWTLLGQNDSFNDEIYNYYNYLWILSALFYKKALMNCKAHYFLFIGNTQSFTFNPEQRNIFQRLFVILDLILDFSKCADSEFGNKNVNSVLNSSLLSGLAGNTFIGLI